MNLLDLGIVVLLALIALRGYYRGLFQEVATLVGVVGGVVVASHLYLKLAFRLQPWIVNPVHAQWVAFGAILVVFYWLTRLAAHFLQRLLYHLYLDFFDRILGGSFALAKGALLIGFGLILLGIFLPKKSILFSGSRTAPHLMAFSRQSLSLLPPDFKQRLNVYLKDWQGTMDRHQAQQTTPEEGETFGPVKQPHQAATRLQVEAVDGLLEQPQNSLLEFFQRAR
jgi:membrane protein required for colicin V production